MMSGLTYFQELDHVLARLKKSEVDILEGAKVAAKTIKAGHWVNLFGSGHSVIPVMDCFPRYGGYVGFYPIMDPRLMWTTPSGPGGPEELLWLERQEGYMDVFLQHHKWDSNDILIVISHGGQNAAPVEVALAAKEAGLYVIAITSEDNHLEKEAIHSSGKKIGDIADLTIFNGVTPEDAVVSVHGVTGKVGGVSTLSAIAIIQALTSETAKFLAEDDYFIKPFASPNVVGISKDHNQQVYTDFRKRRK